MDPTKRKALDYIDSQSGEAREISRVIWQFAEVALEEFKSAELLEDLLEQNGFAVQRGVGDLPTAFIARAGEGGGLHYAVSGASEQGEGRPKSREGVGEDGGAGNLLTAPHDDFLVRAHQAHLIDGAQGGGAR